MPESSEREVMTIKEAAEYLRVHKATIRRWVELGIIRAHRIGGSLRFRRSELLDAVDKHEITFAEEAQ